MSTRSTDKPTDVWFCCFAAAYFLANTAFFVVLCVLSGGALVANVAAAACLQTLAMEAPPRASSSRRPRPRPAQQATVHEAYNPAFGGIAQTAHFDPAARFDPYARLYAQPEPQQQRGAYGVTTSLLPGMAQDVAVQPQAATAAPAFLQEFNPYALDGVVTGDPSYVVVGLPMSDPAQVSVAYDASQHVSVSHTRPISAAETQHYIAQFEAEVAQHWQEHYAHLDSEGRVIAPPAQQHQQHPEPPHPPLQQPTIVETASAGAAAPATEDAVGSARVQRSFSVGTHAEAVNPDSVEQWWERPAQPPTHMYARRTITGRQLLAGHPAVHDANFPDVTVYTREDGAAVREWMRRERVLEQGASTAGCNATEQSEAQAPAEHDAVPGVSAYGQSSHMSAQQGDFRCPDACISHARSAHAAAGSGAQQDGDIADLSPRQMHGVHSEAMPANGEGRVQLTFQQSIEAQNAAACVSPRSFQCEADVQDDCKCGEVQPDAHCIEQKRILMRNDTAFDGEPRANKGAPHSDSQACSSVASACSSANDGDSSRHLYRTASGADSLCGEKGSMLQPSLLCEHSACGLVAVHGAAVRVNA